MKEQLSHTLSLSPYIFRFLSFYLMSFFCFRILSRVSHYINHYVSLGSSWLWQFLRLLLFLMTQRVLTLRVILVRYFVKCPFIVLFFFFFLFYGLTKVKSFEEEHTDKWPFSSYHIKRPAWHELALLMLTLTNPGEVAFVRFLLCKVSLTPPDPLLYYIPWERSMDVHAQSYPTFCDPMDCSPPGSSAHGILQARILECVAISYCRGSSQPRDWTHISCISCTGR